MADARRFEELVFRCLELLESEGHAAVDAFLEDCPGEAPEVRQRLASLERSGLLAGAAAPAAVPERLGDFRLVEVLGGGGMGIVYRAVQESLGREVALKLIRPEQLYFPGARERFEREVRIVAGLSHPGIVPVYLVGEERGLPYFAMERVEGCTLGRALEALESRDAGGLDGAQLARAVARSGGVEPPEELAPLFRLGWVELCLTLVREVAEALEHAHRAGVLHRDVKPSNVMVTAGGRVMLLDFGLSASESSGGSIDRLTRTGSQIGSLPYLPPERLARAGRFDRRSDVYALGVTLYELLTLRLPFRGETAAELVSAIAAGRPAPVRRFQPRVSWDVETICQVAMDPDPERRYPSADALARDLTNALEHRPIAARRTSAVRRLGRWVQRHPGWAAAALTASLAATAGPTLFALQQARAAERLGRESRLAADSLGRSLEAIDEMLVVLGGREIRDVPHLERKRRELLERALELYGEIEAGLEPPLVAGERGERLASALRFQRLNATATLAAIYQQLGKPAEAEQAYGEVIGAAGSELVASEGEGSMRRGALRKLLAEAHQGLAEGLSARGDHEGGARERRRAIELVSAAEAAERDPALVRALFGLRKGLADDLWRGGDTEEALALLRSVLEERGGDVPLLDRASARTSLGVYLYWQLRYEEAEPHLLAAIEEAERALETTPQVASGLELLSRAHTNLAATYLAWMPIRAAEAEPHFARAVELEADLARSFPSSVEYTYGLANALSNHGNSLNYVEGRRSEGYAKTEEALGYLDDLTRRFPDELDYASSRGQCLSVLGILSVDLGHEARAAGAEERAVELYQRSLGWFDRAVQSLSGILELRPGNEEVSGLLKMARAGWSAGLIALGRHAEAAEQVRAAVRAPVSDWRTMRGNAGRFLMCASLTEDAELRAAYVEEAMQTLELAVDLGYRDLEDLLETPLLEPLRGRADFPSLRARVEGE